MWTPDQTGTLGELVASSASLLRGVDASSSDGRVSDAPDARNIRYYQGLGLVDRPLRYDGRRAIYGRVHLVQVLAVKLLQGQGYSLARIQEAFGQQPFAAIEAAVLRALGQAPSADPTPSSDLPARPTFVVAPGVQLTLDPDLVPDPQALARRIQAFLQGAQP